MVKRYWLALPCLWALGACGDDGGDGSITPDAAIADEVDATPQPVCTLIEESYADLGMMTGTATVKPIDADLPDGDKVFRLEFPLNQDTEPDLLILELYGDSPPYDSGPAPYSATLIADNSDLFRCGTCAYIAADFTTPQMINFNMAYSGQLELSVLDPTSSTGKVTGSLSNLKLHEVIVTPAGDQETVAGGCKSTLEKVQFDFDVVVATP